MTAANPYYAVIATDFPMTLTVVAVGSHQFCAAHLMRWLKDNPLTENQTAELLYRGRPLVPTERSPT